MRPMSDHVRVFVVSCRLSDAEMKALQEMTRNTESSISDLLRQGLECLCRNAGTDTLPGLIAKNRMEKNREKRHPVTDKKIAGNGIPFRRSIIRK